jgi:PPOX class probable F420-dependent enzyme
MAKKLEEKHLALLRDTNFGVVGTVNEDGRLQTSVVWVDTDGEHVVFNTRNDRAKGRNLRTTPRASISVWDADDPLRYSEFEGPVELTEEGANEHIHELSRKYDGIDFHTPENRVIVKLVPERILDHNI